MALWAFLALTGTTATLLALPTLPALLELRDRRDAAPLRTSRDDGRIANFAEVFASRMENFRPQFEQCRLRSEVLRTSHEGMAVLLAGNPDFDFSPQLTRDVSAVMCGCDAEIPSGRVVEADVFADGLRIGDGAVLRAGMSTADIVLGKNAAVLRWLHARGSIHLQENSAAYARLAAELSIVLERRCKFQRIQAPDIWTVDPGGRWFHEVTDSSCEDESDLFASSRQRIRKHGDFVLPDQAILNANVIATGELRFGRDVRFTGSAKSHKDAFLGDGAHVNGSIVCGGTLHIGERCFIAGPIMAEHEILMGNGSYVGAPNALTTIASQVVTIGHGCRICGSVWARVGGRVASGRTRGDTGAND